MSVTVERLQVEVQADVRQALRGLDQVERKTASATSRGKKMARSFGVAFTGAAVVGGIKKVADLAMDFDATLRQVGVQAELSGKKLANMGDLALKMGQDTAYSAQDAAGAMLELAKGGLTAAQIKGGALKETLTLAAAGGLELGSAATYVTQGMNTFGIGAAKANQIVTALAGGANASTASVESMGMALSQAGAGAVNAGMSIQETVAALAAFDNAGIKGSDAGTSLKTMLSNLVPATDQARDAMSKYGLEFVKRNGDFKDMGQVAQELKEGLGKLSQAERVQAMRTIFGSDATRAATVLMKEGAKGLGKYLKATRDTAKAQEMANETMSGAKGAVENLKGSVETAAIRLGTKLLPALEDAANGGADFIAEVSTWGPAVQENFGWMVDAAKSLGGPLKVTAGLVESLAGFVGDLPQPVREMGVQAGIAALILPRLTAGVASVTGAVSLNMARLAQWRAEMTYTQTRAQLLTAATGRMGAAMTTAAGIAGMVALTQAGKITNDTLSALTYTAGGAALGFSVGGPLGGALGGTAGLLYGLSKAGGKADDAFAGTIRQANALGEEVGTAEAWAAVADSAYDRIRGSLNDLSAAYTKTTAAAVYNSLQEQGAFKNVEALGLSRRDVVKATLGQASALSRVNAALDPHNIKTQEAFDAAMALEGAVGAVGGTLRQSTRDIRNEADATQSLATRLGLTRAEFAKLPKRVKLSIQNDVPDSMREIRKLSKQVGGLDRKTVKILVSALGTEPTKKRLDGVMASLRKVDNTKATLKGWLSGLKTATAQGAKFSDGERRTIVAKLEAIEKAKPNLAPYVASVRTAVTQARGKASESTSVGAQLKAGLLSGMAGTSSALSAIMSGAVRDAIAAARAAAKIKSPSKETAYIGRMMAKGAEEGMKERKGKLAERARDLVREVLDAFRSGEQDARKLLAKVARLGSDALSGKAEDRFLARVRRTNKSLASLYDRRAAIAKKLAAAQDVAASRRNVKSEFIQSATTGMAQQATVLNAGNTAGHIASSLIAQVAKVKRFAGLLKKLRDMKYSEAIISQVAGAGVEGGMQAAEALAAASGAERTSIVQSFATIQATASSTAKALGASLYDAGIAAADGLVAGLKKRRKAVEQTIMDIAMAMQKALRRALGIKSPSKVFAKLGVFTGQGMVNGLLSQERNVAQAASRLGVAATYASTKGLTPANISGGSRAGQGIAFSFTTINPQAEPQSRTTNKALARVASLGLV